MQVSQRLTDYMHALDELRGRTIQLFDIATSEDMLHTSPLSGFRPILWHLAHIGAFGGYWVLQRAKGDPSLNPRYDVLFDPIRTPREDSAQLPSRAEMQAYLDETHARIKRYVEDLDAGGDSSDPLLANGYVFELIMDHERQHQETVAFLLQALPLEAKKPGPRAPVGKRREPAQQVRVPALRVQIGAGGALPFAYDNELPPHVVELAAFFIDRDLITNAEYAEFIDAGGYHRREWWNDDGWRWKEEKKVDRPLFWSGPPWTERRMFDQGPIHEDSPVTGISWFEAEAFARSRGARLPTEFEWEAAAAYDPTNDLKHAYAWGDDPYSSDRANADATLWGTTPVGAYPRGDSALGLHDCNGNLWEWTSTPFAGYPEFRAYPYPEYSEIWFDGDHRVSRGGSWFSAPDLLRASFRNFYRRNFRAAFIGFRCARDGT